jgi:hypothetical protein
MEFFLGIEGEEEGEGEQRLPGKACLISHHRRSDTFVRDTAPGREWDKPVARQTIIACL